MHPPQPQGYSTMICHIFIKIRLLSFIVWYCMGPNFLYVLYLHGNNLKGAERHPCVLCAPTPTPRDWDKSILLSLTLRQLTYNCCCSDITKETDTRVAEAVSWIIINLHILCLIIKVFLFTGIGS